MPKEELAIMAIREELMEYFKGDCVERFVERGVVRIRPKNYMDETRPYWYVRREREVASEGFLELNGVRLAELSKSPLQLLFVAETMNRSQELRRLRKEIEKFLYNYLPAVEKGEIDGHAR